MGGVALVGRGRENLCRRATARERLEFGGRAWVVEAQGLPNLVHELVHALFLGRLEDDHGFDYKEIPLDLDLATHRRWLWEELACCAISATTCAPLQDDPQRFMRDWFAEQLEIQGVFHGLEHDLDAFVAHLRGQLARPDRASELEAVVEEGRRRLREALVEISIIEEIRTEAIAAKIVPPCDVMVIWQTYLACRAKSVGLESKPEPVEPGRSQVP